MSRTKHSFMAGVKDMLPILVGVVPFGLVAGAAVIHAGQGLAEAIGMSVIVFAGASQIIATTLFGDHAPLWVALLTALIVNSRMFIYSTSIAPLLSDAPAWQRPFLGYMLVDQNYAAVMTQGPLPRRRRHRPVLRRRVGGARERLAGHQHRRRASRPGHPAVVGTRVRGAARLPRDARAVAQATRPPSASRW